MTADTINIPFAQALSNLLEHMPSMIRQMRQLWIPLSEKNKKVALCN
jgi:hypothetical protein